MFGQTVWERNLHQPGRAAGLAVTAEHIVVHERWTRLVGLDPLDGAQRWDIPVGTWPRATVVVGERCLVIPQNLPRLSCLDVRTGETLWTAQLAEFTGHLVATEDTVLVGGWRGYTPLTAFDLQTGTLLWRNPERAEIAVPLVTEAGVLVGEPHGAEIRLVEPRDGRITRRWSLPEPLASGDAQPVLTSLDSDRVLARCGPRTVLELSLSTGAAAVFHRSDSDFHPLLPQAVSRTGPILWVPAARRLVTAIDAHDGRLLRIFAASEVDHPVQADSGFVVADWRGGLALVVPDPEDPRYSTHSRRITQRIRALRGHGPHTVLVLTKGTLRVVEVDSSVDAA
ncbi:outer membrane protein assembly factor BamB family protein [Kitasatospora mediocidica]|uniref:outer membrane protein assembly factor BamB family protein n=1 Tax=Kitasatospora mediocidica TaxID=58352 RepID=UPI00055D1E83|nr:PQQ-binding-like beta-propeller repeat protein [Kitasatospora mediocidica]